MVLGIPVKIYNVTWQQSRNKVYLKTADKPGGCTDVVSPGRSLLDLIARLELVRAFARGF
jgi:hypothetical protein